MEDDITTSNPKNDGKEEIMKRKNLYPDNWGFVLYNVLTTRECEEIIWQGENIGLEKTFESERIRKTDRVLVWSEGL